MQYNETTDKERFYNDFPELTKDVRYSDVQLEILRHGSEVGLDITIYSNPEIPVELMQQIYVWLRSVHRYNVRYTEDGGLTIDTASYIQHTKKEALYSFYNEYSKCNVVVVDVREESEV